MSLLACGDDDSDQPDREEIGDFTDGSMAEGGIEDAGIDEDEVPLDLGSGDGDGDTGTDETGDGETGDGDDETGDGDGAEAEEDLPTTACKAWEITYDLTGSKFQISDTPLGLGNQINVVGEPYDADDKVGPGKFVLRFQDVDGAPGNRAFMVSYNVAIHFRVKRTGADVTTTLDGEAGPNECGVTSGALTDTTVAWMPSAIPDYHTRGDIRCKGAFCHLADLPKNNKPKKIDDVSDQPLSDFVFSGDLSSFTMARTVVSKNANSTSSWAYLGTEVSRTQIDAPDCLCQ